MACGKETSIELRAIIVALSRAGFPLILPLFPSTISRIITRYIKLGTLSSHYPGRKPALSSRERRHLVSSVLRNRFAPTRQRLADLNLQYKSKSSQLFPRYPDTRFYFKYPHSSDIIEVCFQLSESPIEILHTRLDSEMQRLSKLGSPELSQSLTERVLCLKVR